MLREAFKRLGAEEKASYIQMAADDKERYERECKAMDYDPKAAKAAKAAAKTTDSGQQQAAIIIISSSTHPHLSPLLPAF